MQGNFIYAGYSTLETITKDGKTSLLTVVGFSDNKTVHMDIQTNEVSIAYNLIDLSDTVNWKHIKTGKIVIEYIIIEADPDSNFLGEVKLGFLNNVDASNGDFHQILDIDMARKSGLYSANMDFGSHGLHCKEDTHFGPIIANSALFQTDTNLGGPDDSTTLTYPAGDGDLAVIIAGDGLNYVDVAITVGYSTAAA